DDPTTALEQARTVLQYKSAHYSAAWPFEIGGLLAGADETTLQSYREFTLPLGMAFQLGDDLLGVFGDPELTAKPSADDLTEGKRTELEACALKNLDPEKAKMLHNLLMDPKSSSQYVEQT